jgi:hypothetical protein
MSAFDNVAENPPHNRLYEHEDAQENDMSIFQSAGWA